MSEEQAEITSLASGGSGIGRLSDGMTVFVPRTAPGDLVALGGIRRHKRHAEAQVATLLNSGPDRIEPVCAHYAADRCGGCQWLHLGAAAQASAKRRIVGDALRRIGKYSVQDPPLVASPRQLAYRTVITLTVVRSEGRTRAGFHDYLEPARVFALERCHIAREELQRLWEAVRDHLDGLPRGDEVRLKLRLAPDGGLHLVVSGAEQTWSGGEPLVAAAKAAGLDVTVWWQPALGAAHHVAGAPGRASDAAFAQVNEEVAAELHAAAVLEAARGLPDSSRIVDLYGGAGQMSVPLAALGHRVTLVESDQRAVSRAMETARARGVRLDCVTGRVEHNLNSLEGAAVVIANPPRAGIDRAVAERLAAIRPSRLVYVSCDPATLARDLTRAGITAAGIHLVRAYDMFPQTSHVETLVVASPRR